MFRLLVSGSRDYSSPRILHMALLQEWIEHPDLVIIHGDARGADTIAKEWGLTHLGRDRVEDFPADWDRYKKAAGHIRNKQMIDTKPDKAIFFFEPGKKNLGTAGCLELAKKAGIPYEVYGKGD